MKDAIRIGCGAGFWGDSVEGPRQLVEHGGIDYLMLDYLAEITMSILARAHGKNPALGYATDFPGVVAQLAPRLKAGGIKVVTNAGGVNPVACKAEIEAKLAALGVTLKVGIVEGDDLLPRVETLRGVREMFTGTAFPAAPWSVNAYLGAFPIAAALDAGADIVLTGRCVDSALALGPLIHEFAWPAGDFDRLAMGSLAGHIIECGVQATGGIVTDWREVAGGWDNMGFPVAICRPDGTFAITKPEGTGGRVSPKTVAEQIVYEIGDPGAYLLPDVTCDFRHVTLEQTGPEWVEVRGACGYAPTADYKVSATFQDGFRCAARMMIGGPEATARAEAVAAAILKRTRRLFAERGWDDYTRIDTEVLGTETNWGAQARRRDSREVILKIAVQHADKNAAELFAREFIPAATSMAQGITGFAGGRSRATPLVRLFSCLIPKSGVAIRVDGAEFTPPGVTWGDGRALVEDLPDSVPAATGETRRVSLLVLAHGRSGDKGDSANIGVLARRPEFVPLLREQLTAAAVKRYFAHFVVGAVERFEIPGLSGFNFLLHQALGGGGIASLRHDPQGKMLAQILMDFPVDVPAAWTAKGWLAT